MRRTIVVLFLAAILAIPTAVRAADPAPGVRGEIQSSMNDAGDKVIDLAGAISQAKYKWRPSKGVRSTAEVFLHVVQVNYMLPMLMGRKPPMSFDELRVIDKSTTDKAKIVQMLKDSYAFANETFLAIEDADLDTQIDMFGNKISKRAGLMVMSSHSHEHLGQSIAYARMAGVTPPWTAREQAEAAKQAAEKKAASGGR